MNLLQFLERCPLGVLRELRLLEDFLDLGVLREVGVFRDLREVGVFLELFLAICKVEGYIIKLEKISIRNISTTY